MTLDSTTIEGMLQTLGTLAGQHAESSPEKVALRTAAQALVYVQQAEVETRFREYLAGVARPLTALEVVHAKLMGVEVPHHLNNETLREIDAVLEKLRHRNV